MKKKSCILATIIFVLSITCRVAEARRFSQEGAVTVKNVTPFSYCCLVHKGSFSEIQTVIGRLMEAMQAQNVFPGGPMLGIYYSAPEQVKPEEMEWEIGFPITDQAMVQAPLEKKQWTYQTVASVLHVGPYDKTSETIGRAMEWLTANGYVPEGPVMEMYQDMNPSQLKPEQLKAEIWIPCRKK